MTTEKRSRWDFSDDDERLAEERLPRMIVRKTYPTYRGTQVRYAVRINRGWYGQFETIQEAIDRRNEIAETFSQI